MTENIIKGPWDIFQSDPDDTYCLTYEGNEFAYINKDQEDAAFVMLAAPDLLEALEKSALVLAGEQMAKSSLVDALEAARAAIAKAKGEGEMDVV